MSAYTVIYSSEALDDLRKIYLHIAFALKAAETARKQVNRIRQRIRALDEFPLRYPLVEWEPWHGMGVHKLPVDHFVVYYAVHEDEKMVAVVRIFYGGRDVERIVDEM